MRGGYKPSFAAHLALPGDARGEYGICLGEDLLYNFTTKKVEPLTDAWDRIDVLRSPHEYWVNRASAETVELIHSMLTPAALNAAD